jgi:hypothetical protein
VIFVKVVDSVVICVYVEEPVVGLGRFRRFIVA